MILENLNHPSMRDTIFEDEDDALQKLINNMPLSFLNKENTIVVGISFNGIRFAYNLSQHLKVPFTFLFTAPIYAPNNPNCEIAMVTETQDVVINEPLVKSFGISLDYIYGEVQRLYEDKMLPLIYQYRKGNPPISLDEKRALIVDIGIDSGLTSMAVIKSMITMHTKIVNFVSPVAPFDVAKSLEDVTDGVFCFYKTNKFVDIKYYYKTYPKVEDKQLDEIFTHM